ncbi:MAG: hypothetical protein ACK5LL_08325 [Suipraeoptans sp.]
MDREDYIVNLNDLESDGDIKCPYCSKGRAYTYGAKGMVSLSCGRCHQMVLWDYDNKTAYKAKVRKFVS